MSKKIKEPDLETPPIKNITPEGEFYEGEPAPLIVVKQLPVIEEHLKSIKEVAEAKTNAALALVCTEETLVAVKEARAALRKDFQQLEDTRKMIEKAISAPVDKFKAEYKKYVTEVFGPADAKLKEKIDEVENELKEAKKAEIAAYFYEYLESKKIDFVTFENANINVTRSASKKSLNEQAKAFIDRICEDLNLIETQEHKVEILIEYKKTLNVSNAITAVVERHKAIEKAKEIEEHLKAQKEAQQKEAEQTPIPTSDPADAPLEAPTVEIPESFKAPTIYEARFRVITSDLEKLKKLITFMEKEGIEYEQF